MAFLIGGSADVRIGGCADVRMCGLVDVRIGGSDFYKKKRDCSAKVCQRVGFPLGTQGAGCKMTHMAVQSRKITKYIL